MKKKYFKFRDKRNSSNLFLISIIFLFFLLSIYFFSKKFPLEFPLSDLAVLLVRKHFVPDLTLTPVFINIFYQLLELLNKLIWFLDQKALFFPSFLKQIFWMERTILLLITFPVICLFFFLGSRAKSGFIKFALIFSAFYFAFPFIFISKNIYNKIVVASNLNFVNPFSNKYVWIWANEPEISPYALFRYEWNQKHLTNNAEIFISNLGHYRLKVNEQDIYDGPSFAIPPKIYYDKIDISKYITLGNNKIEIIANFVKVPVHEYANYQFPGLLVGGEIKDGLFYRDLANFRFWQSANMENIKNGKKISDAGYTEIDDYTISNYSSSQARKINSEFVPQVRPTPYLTYEPIKLSKKGNYYDLKTFKAGYLEVNSNLNKSCTLKTKWGVDLNSEGKVVDYYNQDDEFVLPSGIYSFRQLSRRAGKYLQADTSGCGGSIDFTFYRVGMPFSVSEEPKFESMMDKSIYSLSLNTLKNNVQDHFEDSVEREKAMYIGDAFAQSKCLMASKDNSYLVSEMIKQFAESQKENGIIPSMTPSGLEQYIPGYSLQWIVWLDWHIGKSGDNKLAYELKPQWKKLLEWAKNNESSDGFLVNRTNEQVWWDFLDWSELDKRYPISVGLQLWYLDALKAAVHLSELTYESSEDYKLRLNKLKNNLFLRAFDQKTGIFTDSFFADGKKSKGNLVTNALAGKLNLFPDQTASLKALNYFKNHLYTNNPYSETWVIEWLINTDNKDLAINVMRNYWGNMIYKGYTAVPEMFEIDSSTPAKGSRSHAWGCSPIWLYKELGFK